MGTMSLVASQTVSFTTFGSSDCSTLAITTMDFVEAGECVGFEYIPFSNFQTIADTVCVAGKSAFLHLSVDSCTTDVDVVRLLDGTTCALWGEETVPDSAYFTCQ